MKDQIEKSYLHSFLISVVLVLWFFIPVLSLFFIFSLWVYLKESSKFVDRGIIFLASVTFGLIAYTGQSIGADETDIARYHFYYTVVGDIESFSSFFVVMVLDGGSNLAFYIINFLISRVFPSNPQVHILFWITVTYFFTLLGVYEVTTYWGKSIPRTVSKFLIFIFLLGIMPFFTVTEIIKQCASVSIFFYALTRRLLNKRWSTQLLVLALLVHASSLILLPVFFLYNNRLVKRYIYLIGIICVILSFFNFNVILTSVLSLLPGGALLASAKEYQNVEVWSISLRHYATFFFYAIIISMAYFEFYKCKKLQIKPELSKIKRDILMVFVLSFMMLLINRGNVHNFVRYIYGFYPFYMLAIIVILKGEIKVYERYGIALIAIVFFTFSNIKLLMVQTSGESNYANSYFDNSAMNILSSNVVQFLNFRI